MTQTMIPSAQAVGAAASDRIRWAIKGHKGAKKGATTAVLCTLLGMSRTTWFSRLNGETDFSAPEIAILADYFGCSIQDLYDGVVRRMDTKVPTVPKPPTSRPISRKDQRRPECPKRPSTPRRRSPGAGGLSPKRTSPVHPQVIPSAALRA